jgi:hypothetical protein
VPVSPTPELDSPLAPLVAVDEVVFVWVVAAVVLVDVDEVPVLVEEDVSVLVFSDCEDGCSASEPDEDAGSSFE